MRRHLCRSWAAHEHDAHDSRTAHLTYAWIVQNEARITTYSPEGVAEEIPLDLHGTHCAAAEQQVAASPIPESVEDLGLGPPVAIEMGIGDAMLMDVRTFHYGSANTSTGGDDDENDVGSRVQLSATFEEPLPTSAVCSSATASNDCASATLQEPDTGFTYELREELRGKYVLGDFLHPTSGWLSE